MKSHKQHNRTFLYIPLAFAFLVLAIFTNEAYSSLQESLIAQEGYKDQVHKKIEERDELKKIKEEIENNKETKKYIEKLSTPFDRKELFKHFYAYIGKNDASDSMIKVKWISFYELWTNDLWFNEWEIKLKMFFANESIMKNYINFLINENPRYLFSIEDFSYPEFWDSNLEDKWFNIVINLKIYYR